MALLDEVLDQTKQAAVQEAALTVAGPDVLTTPEVLARLEQYQAATQAIIDRQDAQINDLLGQTANLLQQLAGKASADSLASVRQRVTNAEAALDAKATTAFVTQQVQAIADLDAGQATAIAGLKTVLDADGGILQNLLAKQAGYDLLLPTLRADVDAKAPAATVSSLTGQVTALRNTVNEPTTGLATRAAGADLATLTTSVAGKAAASDVSALATTVSTKASAADLQALATTVAGKALSSDLTTTNNNVAANTSAIALRATTAALATERSRLDTLLATTVPALQADTASRLLRAGDAATGSIMVPQATTAAAAPRLDQTYGGLNAPIRFATAVGATAVAMQPGPLADPTPQGRKAKPYLVVLTMRTAPTIGATITVGTTSGGAEVFTKTYTLALLPGLNAVLAPMQPIFIELPAGTTLYAKATAGTWDVEVLSYYKS